MRSRPQNWFLQAAITLLQETPTIMNLPSPPVHPDSIADSMHKIRYGGWSKFRDNAFREIAMRMDTTSAVRVAACSKELRRQVAGGKGSRCPNDGCGTLVAFHDFLNHK